MDKDFFESLKAGNYNRKSSEAEDRQVLSISSQNDEACRLKESLGINSMVSYDDAKSAKEAGVRIGYSNLIQDIKASKIDAIICWKLDRLARNMLEAGEIITLLQLNVIKAIITPTKTYLPNENVLVLAIEFGIANQFSRDLSVNVKRGQNKKASMGFPHGLATLGFKNDKSEEKGNRKWLVDEPRFLLVKEVFKLYLTGNYSGGQMYDWAVQAGLTTPRHKKNGGKLITLSRIYKILKDTTYAGFFYQGGKRYELHESLPRIVTEEEHYRILRMLSGKNIPKTQIHLSPYAGFILSSNKEFIGSDFKYQVICECKYKFSYINKTHCPKCEKEIILIKNPKYLEYEYYYNVSRKKKKLGIKSISQKEITEFLLDFASKFTFSPAFADWSRKYIKELHDAEVESNLIVAESQKERLETLEKKKENYRGLLADGLIKREEYEHDIQIIQVEIKKIQENSQKSVNWAEEAEKIIDLGLELKNILKNGTVTAKREVLSKLGSNLIWDEEELFISNTKPIQILIDGLEWAREKNPRFEPENVIDTSKQNSYFWDIRPKMLRG